MKSQKQKLPTFSYKRINIFFDMSITLSKKSSKIMLRKNFISEFFKVLSRTDQKLNKKSYFDIHKKENFRADMSDIIYL